MSKKVVKSVKKPVAKVAKVAVKKSAKVAAPKRTHFDADKRIVVLPAGKANPRRKGSGAFNRYNVLLKSRTVGAFLKSQPKWHSTIVRAVSEKLIRVGG
jgi:hypothetical protein